MVKKMLMKKQQHRKGNPRLRWAETYFSYVGILSHVRSLDHFMLDVEDEKNTSNCLITAPTVSLLWHDSYCPIILSY